MTSDYQVSSKAKFTYVGGNGPETRVELERRVKMAFNRIFDLALKIREDKSIEREGH